MEMFAKTHTGFTTANAISWLFVQYKIDLDNGAEWYELEGGVEDYMNANFPTRFSAEEHTHTAWLLPDNSVFEFSPQKGCRTGMSEAQDLWISPR